MRKITETTRFTVGQKLYRTKSLTLYHTITRINGDLLWIRFSAWGKDDRARGYSIKHMVFEDKWYVHDITEYFEAIHNQ